MPFIPNRLPPDAPANETGSVPVELPRCAACEAASEVALSTDYVLYLRCPRCGAVWSVAKPGDSLRAG